MKDFYILIKKLLPGTLRKSLKPWYLKWKLRRFTQPQCVKVKKYGFLIMLDPANRAVDEYIYIHRNWETKIGDIIAREVSNGATFIDVGANIGWH